MKPFARATILAVATTLALAACNKPADKAATGADGKTAEASKDAAAKTGYPGLPTEKEQASYMIGMSVGSSRVDLQACKLEYSIVSPK